MSDVRWLGDGVWVSAVTVVVTVMLISALAATSSLAFRKRPALRHSFLFSALVACLAAPMFALTVALTGHPILAVPVRAPTESIAMNEPTTANDASVPLEMAGREVRPFTDDEADRSAGLASEPFQPDREPPRDPSASSSPTPSASWKLPESFGSPFTWMASVWLLGTLVILTRTALAAWRVGRLIGAARPVASDEIQTTAAVAAKHVGLEQPPRLLASCEIRSPAVVGYRRMAVVIPAEIFSVTADDEFQNVLIHEFAHVRRWDPPVVLIQAIARGLFWPIVTIHWLDRELSRAREEICDNYVLEQTSTLAYGETLLKLGQLAIGARPLAGSVGILNWRGELEQRIAGFLDSERSRETATPRLKAVTLILVALLATAVLCGTRLVAATETQQAAGAQTDTDATGESDQTDETEDADEARLNDPEKTARFETKIVNGTGEPVANARVELWQLAFRSGSASPDPLYRREHVSDEQGRISVPYSIFIDQKQKLPATRVALRISHPEYADWSNYLPVTQNAPIVLPTPTWLTAAANLPSGSPVTSDLYAVTSGLAPQTRMVGPTLRVGPLDLLGGRASNVMRLVYAPTDGPMFFSDRVDLAQEPRADNEINLALTLSPSATVTGELSDDVPRPVTGGFVIATILDGVGMGAQWRWTTKCPIAADGTFVVHSLPAEQHLQLIAVCDGWISLPPRPSQVDDYADETGFNVQFNHGAGTGRVTPQLHYVSDGTSETTIQMHPAGTAQIKVVDWQDKPIPGATVSFYPNQAFHNGGSQGLGMGIEASEILRMLKMSPDERRVASRTRRGNLGRSYQAVTDANGEAIIKNLPAHQSWHAVDGEDHPGGRFIGFRVGADGYRMVPKEPQRIISSGGSLQETIDMIPGEIAKIKVRMEPVGQKNRVASSAVPIRSRTTPAATPKPAPTPNPAATSKPKTDSEETVPITVRGVCRDSDGKPVAGASVELLSVNRTDRRLGRTQTDAQGRYQFVDAEVPVFRSKDFIDGGTINVFGTADGYGLSWHGMRSVLLEPRPENNPRGEQSTSFYLGEPIDMDLEFVPPAKLHGRIIDDEGKPVSGASVQISGIDYLDTEGKVYHHNYREFWGLKYADASMRVTQSNADGNFEIAGLPENTVVWVRISHDQFASQSLYAAITDRNIDEYTYASGSMTSIKDGKQVKYPRYETKKVATCPLAIGVARNKSVSVRVVDRDDVPVPDVRVSATSGGRATGTHASVKTGNDGSATLKLPPGKYRMSARPSRDTAYVTTYDQLTIPKDAALEVHQVRLVTGCTLILKAIDADDGKPIAGMSFWTNPDDKPNARTGLNSTPMYVDHPVTNENGILRVVVKPGTRKIGVGWSNVPKPYQGGGGGREVQCKEAETIEVTFEVRKTR